MHQIELHFSVSFTGKLFFFRISPEMFRKIYRKKNSFAVSFQWSCWCTTCDFINKKETQANGFSCEYCEVFFSRLLPPFWQFFKLSRSKVSVSNIFQYLFKTWLTKDTLSRLLNDGSITEEVNVVFHKAAQ